MNRLFVSKPMIALLPPLMLVAVFIFQPFIDPRWLFLDAVTAAEMSEDCCRSYFGFVSTLGVVLWGATSSIAAFATFFLIDQKAPKPLINFSATAFVLSGWLMLDDAFLVHEGILPALGVSQELVLGIYALMVLGYLAFNFQTMLKYDAWILVLALMCFAISLLVDIISHELSRTVIALEDGAKFVGIWLWTLFHANAMYQMVKGAFQTKI